MIGSHREQAQFSRAKWRKRVLLPCWIAQIPILLGMVGVFSYRLSNTVNTFKDEESKGDVPMVEFVWECANIAFSFGSFIIVAMQIAKFVAEALTPLGMLFGNIISLVLSFVILALDVVVYVQRADREYSIVGLAMDCTLLVFTIIPTIYGVIIYRRLLAYDDYHLPHNVKHYGFDRPADTSYKPPTIRMSLERTASYDPENPSASRSRRPSVTISIKSSRTEDKPGEPSPRPEIQRRASYDHRRSTQFDDYVARRLSGAIAKDDAERALGGSGGSDFGWDDARRESLGVYPSRSRGNSVGRSAAGYEASVSTSPSSSTVQIGHSLVAVPEGPEEDRHVGRVNRAAPRSTSEDRAALLESDIERRPSGNSTVSHESYPTSLSPAQRPTSRHRVV